MLTSILIISLFVVIAILMITKKIPTLVALPILAIGVAVIAGVPLTLIDAKTKADTGILNFIIQGGATRLSAAYVAVIFGAWLGQLMNHTGISKTIVKGAAELAGDKPFLVTLLLSAAVAVLFTTIDGLGAVIMIATIVVPIMISVGVPGLTAVCMFLFGMATGLMFNISNWAFYASATGVKQADVQTFAFVLCILTAVTGVIFAIVEFKRQGIKFSWAAQTSTTINTENEKAPLLSLFTPIIPILFVVVLKWAIIPSFIMGILWCVLTVYIFGKDKKFGHIMSLVTKSAFEGVADSAPAVLLMIGIGMVLNSLMHPMVSASITPLLKAVIPSSAFAYVIFFAILAPLALYRGPLNMWGLGSGIAAVIISLNILPAPAVFSAFLSTERVQAIGDPTNTHNVWLANYVGTDVNEVLKKVLPYIWGLAIVGIVISSIMWF